MRTGVRGLSHLRGPVRGLLGDYLRSILTTGVTSVEATVPGEATCATEEESLPRSKHRTGLPGSTRHGATETSSKEETGAKQETQYPH